jgi:hypothetical protein
MRCDMANMKSIWSWVIWFTIPLAAPSVMAQPFQNGDFTDDLNYWTVDAGEFGTDIDVVLYEGSDLQSHYGALFRGPGDGSLTQIHQVVDPTQMGLTPMFNFQYAFKTVGQADTSLPPDSFLVFLVDETAGASMAENYA